MTRGVLVGGVGSKKRRRMFSRALVHAGFVIQNCAFVYKMQMFIS